MRRAIKAIYKGEPVTEGAGVKLRRIFGYYEAPEFDPFLLFDDFRSDKPEDFKRGFPWHPHRGIECSRVVKLWSAMISRRLGSGRSWYLARTCPMSASHAVMKRRASERQGW